MPTFPSAWLFSYPFAFLQQLYHEYFGPLNKFIRFPLAIPKWSMRTIGDSFKICRIKQGRHKTGTPPPLSFPQLTGCPLGSSEGVRSSTADSCYKNLKTGRFKAGDATQNSVLFVCLWNKRQRDIGSGGEKHQHSFMNYSSFLALILDSSVLCFCFSRCSSVFLHVNFFLFYYPVHHQLAGPWHQLKGHFP